MKSINVVAAIIRNAEGRVFCTQRGYGEWKDWWEFPGGKIDAGETPQEALKREIREELDTEIEVGELLTAVEYDYPKFHLSMQCFLCTFKLRDESLELRDESLELRDECLELRDECLELRDECLELRDECLELREDALYKLLEHEDARWLSKEELDTVKWLPADKNIIRLLKDI